VKFHLAQSCLEPLNVAIFLKQRDLITCYMQTPASLIAQEKVLRF